MPSFSEGHLLPAKLQAGRKIANASKWHCTALTVIGAGAGVPAPTRKQLHPASKLWLLNKSKEDGQ
jgi:hypothetical protein